MYLVGAPIQPEDLTSRFEARELRQILAVRPPYFPRDSTLTLVGSYRLEVQRIQ